MSLRSFHVRIHADRSLLEVCLVHHLADQKHLLSLKVMTSQAGPLRRFGRHRNEWVKTKIRS